MAIKKVVVNNNVELDLTQDTIAEQYVASGKTFHNSSGLQKTGNKVDIDLSNDTIAEQYVTSGKTFHDAQGLQKTGTKIDIDLSGDTITAEDVLNNKTFHNSNGQLQTGTAILEEGGYSSWSDALDDLGDAEKIYYKEYMGIDTWTYTGGNFIMIGNDDGVTHSETTNPSSSNLAFYRTNELTSEKMATILNELALNNSTIPDGKCLAYDHTNSIWSWVEQSEEQVIPTSTGSATFSDGTVLTWEELKLEANGTEYGYDAFSVLDTTISDGGFWSCTNLTSIDIPSSVTDINGSAFYGCTSLTSITIPDSVTHIGNSAFKECTGLTSIIIPDSVTSVDCSVFENCTSLTSVEIPGSVTSIDYQAFYNCPGLTSITFQGTQSQWNAITKRSNWNQRTGAYTIHCTDECLNKNGNVTNCSIHKCGLFDKDENLIKSWDKLVEEGLVTVE